MSTIRKIHIASRCLVSGRRRLPVSTLMPSAHLSSNHLNPPLDLDPSMKALLQDPDISLMSRKHPRTHRELELLETEPASVEDLTADVQSEDDFSSRESKKSPAAEFGSQRIGNVSLPHELQQTIQNIIAESDKTQLHNDAKRLFHDSEGHEDQEWQAEYDVKYRSRLQRQRHDIRDGTAFASIALPAHYSAIFSVLDHVRHRLGPQWAVQRIIDWGSGTGSALWACAYSFQKLPDREGDTFSHEPRLANSTLRTYLGIDHRDGLTSIGKRLLFDVDRGSVSASWQRNFRDENRLRRTEAGDTLAISAFNLSSLPNAFARKDLVKEIWESGANVIVLMDHGTTSGYECIAAARAQLLKMGRKEMDDPATEDWPIRGCHVVAPCPHDAECPLYNPGFCKVPCTFSQRLQRPAFVRLTKHSNVGHEDILYSYVVIRRGPRPPSASTRAGRVGTVGQAALDNISRDNLKELHSYHERGEEQTRVEDDSLMVNLATESPEELQNTLRGEAYGWPRLVFPPLKRSGHIIIDGCTSGGKIMRMTIPKSQGKQPYYDARKSRWGDIFPHDPKNPPQERHNPNRNQGRAATKVGTIGKGLKGEEKARKSEQRISYDWVSKELKQAKKDKRRERACTKDWDLDDDA